MALSDGGQDLIFRGYGDTSKLHPRSPRLDFDEACRVM